MTKEKERYIKRVKNIYCELVETILTDTFLTLEDVIDIMMYFGKLAHTTEVVSASRLDDSILTKLYSIKNIEN